jgi:hypothetical protein
MDEAGDRGSASPHPRWSRGWTEQDKRRRGQSARFEPYGFYIGALSRCDLSCDPVWANRMAGFLGSLVRRAMSERHLATLWRENRRFARPE